MTRPHILSLLLFSFSMTTTLALSTLSPRAPQATMEQVRATNDFVPTIEKGDTRATTESASWRVVLDLGRESLSTMPFDWGRSGCRMPLVIPCDFVGVSGSDRGDVYPASSTVSVTGPEGAMEYGIQAGDWALKEASSDNGGEICFSLRFPDSMARRDVTIEAGTVLTLTGTTYAKEMIDRLNEEYCDAREKVWKIEEEINEMSRRRNAPKKWNEATQKWEQRYPTESPLKVVQKRIELLAAQAVQQQKSNARLRSNTLSQQGPFPGLGKPIFLQKEGVVRLKDSGAVVGRWSAEPMK